MAPGRTAMGPKTRTALTLGLVLAALAVALTTALLVYGPQRDIETRHARLTRKADLVAHMRADLYAAAQSEKSAVLAETDEASKDFAAAAVTAVGRVDAGLAQFRKLGGDQEEEALTRDFAAAFDEYRKVDQEVLTLAVQNTNLKALALSFGPAQAALADMDRALAPLADNVQAQRALAETLRIQSLHAPHIMEKTGERMDALERDMARSSRAAHAALAALPQGPERTAAQAAFERHAKITAEVLALSRQNTNVRSLTLSLERKTKVLASCVESLRVLEEFLRSHLDTRATR